MVYSQWVQLTELREYCSKIDASSKTAFRYTGNFTNVVVPASPPISWSVPFDTISYVASGTTQSMTGLLASIDIYRSIHFISCVLSLVADSVNF